MGGDLRIADRNHAAAVARLQAQIFEGRHALEAATSEPACEQVQRAVTTADHATAAWLHYTRLLQGDEQKRAAMPTSTEIDDEYERVMQSIEAGEGDFERNPVAVFNLYTDHELKAGARHFDHQNRARRLSALRSSVDIGDTHFVDASVRQFVTDHMELASPPAFS